MWCHCVLTVLCVVSLCSDSAMCGVVMFWHCYVWCCYVMTVLCAVSLCSFSAMCNVVFWQCYVRCRRVLTVLCISVYFSYFLVSTLCLWLNSLRLDAPSSFDIYRVTSQFLNLCSTIRRVSHYQTYKQAVALAIRSNAGSFDNAVPLCRCLLTVVTERKGRLLAVRLWTLHCPHSVTSRHTAPLMLHWTFASVSHLQAYWNSVAECFLHWYHSVNVILFTTFGKTQPSLCDFHEIRLCDFHEIRTQLFLLTSCVELYRTRTKNLVRKNKIS